MRRILHAIRQAWGIIGASGGAVPEPLNRCPRGIAWLSKATYVVAFDQTGPMAIERQAQPQGKGRHRSLAVNTVNGAIARGLYGGTLLVGSIFVAQFQGVDALGSFGLAVVLATFAATIADGGMSQYLVPRLAQAQPDEWGRILGTVRRFQLVSALPATAAFAVVVTLAYSGEDRTALLATIPWWLFTRATLSLRAIFTVKECLSPDARAGIAEAVVGLALLGAASHWLDSPSWALLALGAGAAVGLILRLRSLNRLGLVAAASENQGLSLLRATWHFNSFNVLVLVYSRIDVILLSLLATQAELGIYQAPVRIVTGILLLPEALTLLLQARASRTPGDRNLHAAQQRMLSIAVISSLPGVALVALFGDDLLAAIYGEPFAAAGLAFTLLAAIVPIRLVNYLNGNQLVAHGYQGVRVTRMALTAAFAAVAGAAAIHLYGYDGAAAITLAAEFVLFALYMAAVRRCVGSEAVLYPVGPLRASV